MKTIRKTMIAVAVILTCMFGSQEMACAGRRVVVRVAPPAPKVVVSARPACPYKQGAWMAGYWNWRHDKHVWVEGHWIKAKPGHMWVDGHWAKTGDGWEWIPGHWRK